MRYHSLPGGASGRYQCEWTPGFPAHPYSPFNPSEVVACCCTDVPIRDSRGWTRRRGGVNFPMTARDLFFCRLELYAGAPSRRTSSRRATSRARGAENKAGRPDGSNGGHDGRLSFETALHDAAEASDLPLLIGSISLECYSQPGYRLLSRDLFARIPAEKYLSRKSESAPGQNWPLYYEKRHNLKDRSICQSDTRHRTETDPPRTQQETTVPLLPLTAFPLPPLPDLNEQSPNPPPRSLPSPSLPSPRQRRTW